MNTSTMGQIGTNALIALLWNHYALTLVSDDLWAEYERHGLENELDALPEGRIWQPALNRCADDDSNPE